MFSFNYRKTLQAIKTHYPTLRENYSMRRRAGSGIYNPACAGSPARSN